MTHRIHIISFDIPYPATYGGAIDVYYRIRALHAAGVAIILHCTYKGELVHYPELENLCECVHYYPRRMSIKGIFSRLPFAVCWRPNRAILCNLLQDDAPILYEGLISCGTMDAPELAHRKKYFRECNVEHNYYRALMHASRNLRDKIYYAIEAGRLERFEQILHHATGIFALAHQDEQHFQVAYPEIPTYYMPCFHPHEQLSCSTGLGHGILYHGNLNVEENRKAVKFIVREIAPALSDIPICISGRYNGKSISAPANVQFVFNPDEETMNRLVCDAQLHLLVTFQPTGLKLKLLNVLYNGRHVVCNPEMVCGTELSTLCHIAPDTESLVHLCRSLYTTPFTSEDVLKRNKTLPDFDNQQLLCSLINNIF